ncbi:MAG: hypothetical protein VX226_09605 [Bacteroidota bacterium]|nr:hypothetical protein [Bacteroidota bacterium]
MGCGTFCSFEIKTDASPKSGGDLERMHAGASGFESLPDHGILKK